ncbi:response regulator [Mesorhizobium sp. LHD-90]|uniref:response regulator n=1 Tax=Mesorhizobium sp. LHD-90 TaxID=3071414 RepID=UPI0027E1951E|nr:response regulator [Mesorhizobium sp. LHD-90]MDQ6433592.1 response regulator [Mesorhizobium sp. LHD-90]
MTALLDGLRILVLEDEFLIAMDVEQICRDDGAADVAIARTLEEADAAISSSAFDAAVVDLRLGNVSTIPFAEKLRQDGIPFVFASGYTDLTEIASSFPGASIVGKPYSGEDLVAALTAARKNKQR